MSEPLVDTHPDADLRTELAEAREEIYYLRDAGTIECMVRNKDVAEHVKHFEERAELHKLRSAWACGECGFSGDGWQLHRDWESGVVDDVGCPECGSVSTGDVREVLRDMARRIERAEAELSARIKERNEAHDTITSLHYERDQLRAQLDAVAKDIATLHQEAMDFYVERDQLRALLQEARACIWPSSTTHEQIRGRIDAALKGTPNE